MLNCCRFTFEKDYLQRTKRQFGGTYVYPGFRIRIFFADPDPGKNLHADPDTGGIRGRGLGVKGF